MQTSEEKKDTESLSSSILGRMERAFITKREGQRGFDKISGGKPKLHPENGFHP